VQPCQPDLRFLAQSLIASSRISSLRCLSSGCSPPGINSPKVTSRLWLQRSLPGVNYVGGRAYLIVAVQVVASRLEMEHLAAIAEPAFQG
jgi:hypothetical protein